MAENDNITIIPPLTISGIALSDNFGTRVKSFLKDVVSTFGLTKDRYNTKAENLDQMSLEITNISIGELINLCKVYDKIGYNNVNKLLQKSTMEELALAMLASQLSSGEKNISNDTKYCLNNSDNGINKEARDDLTSKIQEIWSSRKNYSSVDALIETCRKTNEKINAKEQPIEFLNEVRYIFQEKLHPLGFETIDVSATPVVEAKATVVPEQNLINPQQERASGQTAGEENKQLNENNINQQPTNEKIMADNTSDDEAKIRENINKIPLTDLLASNEGKAHFQLGDSNSERTPEADNYEFLNKALLKKNLNVFDRSVTVQDALKCLDNVIERTVVNAGDIQSGDRQKYQNAHKALSISLTAYSVLPQEQEQQSSADFLTNPTGGQTTEANGGGSQVKGSFPKQKDEGKNPDTTNPNQTQQGNTDNPNQTTTTQTPQQNGNNGDGNNNGGGDTKQSGPILKKNKKLVNLDPDLFDFNDFAQKPSPVSGLLEEIDNEIDNWKNKQKQAEEQRKQELKKLQEKLNINDNFKKQLEDQISGLNISSQQDTALPDIKDQINKLRESRDKAEKDNKVLNAVRGFADNDGVTLEQLKIVAEIEGKIPQYNDLSIKNNKQYLTNTFQSLVGENFDINQVTDAYQLPRKDGKDGNLVICYKNDKGQEEWFTDGPARFAVESGEIYQGGPGKLKALETNKVIAATDERIKENNEIIESVDNALRQYGHLEGNSQDNSQTSQNTPQEPKLKVNENTDNRKRNSQQPQTPGPEQPKVILEAEAHSQTITTKNGKVINNSAKVSTSYAKNVNNSSITIHSGEETSNQTIKTKDITKNGKTSGGPKSKPYNSETSVLNKFVNPEQGNQRY